MYWQIIAPLCYDPSVYSFSKHFVSNFFPNEDLLLDTRTHQKKKTGTVESYTA